MSVAQYNLRYSLRRQYVDEFMSSQAVCWQAGLRVLDLGGNREQKRGRFNIAQYPVSVVYLNLSTAKNPDICADAANLPFLEDSFDVVVCSEVLEHVMDPVPVLAEISRVLRRGGEGLITCPFMFRVHGDPDDFARYTPGYWSHVLSRAGFSSVTIVSQGRFYSVIVDFLKQYAVALGGGVSVRILQWILPTLQVWAMRRDASERSKNNAFLSSFSTGYAIVFNKA